MRRNVWETDEPFVQVVQQDGKVYLRTYAGSGSAPIVVELDVSEAMGLAIELTNKARVIVERTTTTVPAVRRSESGYGIPQRDR